ncbi:porin family protein [Flavobacterium sp. Fl-318]|uniref:Porin family protein n=1 Tax=Flavobacterium cupriresistens TaxID=2893885 RepID=A0ABU4RF52_9FLAO|nr:MULTISPECIES: porin family protein [unclassified Flavobacterium]MDX6191234.1 porin family protein [Flavobacterium sp. Fl-318]UFH42447.1 porin family protein [Flavobacterium sp. F-323]
MKNFILALLLCISVNGFAQLIQFGPQFSTNITSAVTDDFSSKSSGTGIGVAGFARVNLLLFYGQAEFGYTQSKFSVSQTGIGETQYEVAGTDATLIAGFKVVPLGKLGNIRLFVGYNWKNYSSIDASNNLNYIPFERNNGSVLGGVGVDLWKFTLDYRYLAGLTDLDASNRELKTGISNISLGYKFL